MLPHRLVYGSYPDVVTHLGDETIILDQLTESYLYKDILEFDKIHKPDKLMKLLQALAWQIGSEVSFNELAQLCECGKSGAYDTFFLSSYKCGSVYGYDTGSALAHCVDVQHLLFCNPVVFVHGLFFHKGQHRVAAAYSEQAYAEEGEEEFEEIFHKLPSEQIVY